jgi:copper transport protein
MTGQRLARLAMRRPALPALLIALTYVIATTPALSVLAHANLVRSDPSSGAVLPAAPNHIQLWFSEQPDTHFSDVRLLDAQRQRFDDGDMHAAPDDPLSLIVGVNAALPDGLYTVSWKTVSAVDGHVVNGNVPFYVGQPPQGAVLPSATQTGPASSSSTPTAASILIRWLSLMSAIVLFGGFTFLPLVLVPSLVDIQRPGAAPGALSAPQALLGRGVDMPPAVLRRANSLLVAAWVLLAIATVAALLQQAQTSSGLGILHLFGTPLRTLLLQTRYGHTWWLRSAAVVLAGGALAMRHRDPLPKSLFANLLGVLAVEAGFFAYSLNSHAAALRSGSVLGTAADLLHLTAVGLWIGGLVQLALITPLLLRHLQAGERTAYLARAVPRFSTLAIVAVATLAVTGGYQAVRQVSGWDALWKTGWGRTLDLKLVLLLPLLLLGALNLLVIRPRLSEASSAPGSADEATEVGRNTVRLERRFIVAVVAESLLGLAIVFVVGILVNQPPPQVATAATPGIHLTSKAEGVTVRLTITPGQLGPNHFQASVDVRGKPPPDGTQLVFRLTYQDADLGTSELTTIAEGKGAYSADSSDLSTYGRWQILALVQPPSADEVRTDFSMAISNSGASGSGTAATGDTSVKKGQQLYAANCAQCHGKDAHGDGPQARFLDPPPADLIVHVPQHSDQQLRDFIANGIPASAMPAFGQKLSAQDREAILNYLRNLTKDQTPAAATPAPAATP